MARGDFKAAAEKLGLKQAQFSNIIAGRRFVSEDDRPRIAKITGVDYVGMVKDLMKSETEGGNETVVEYNDLRSIKKKHGQLVTDPGFIDEKRGIQVNEYLLEIEKIDPATFRQLVEMVEMYWEKTKNKATKKINTSLDKKTMGEA